MKLINSKMYKIILLSLNSYPINYYVNSYFYYSIYFGCTIYFNINHLHEWGSKYPCATTLTSPSR